MVRLVSAYKPVTAADIKAFERYFCALTKFGPLDLIERMVTTEERCALLENQVAQAEQALALERAASADLSRRLQHVLDRLRAFAAQI